MAENNPNNDDNNYSINGINIRRVPRLPYPALIEISQLSRSRINPNVYNPRENRRHYRMNSYAKFYCIDCNNEWSSNKVTVELWWAKGKWEFDVRMYGQQCKHCNGEFLRPQLTNLRKIKNICVRILTNTYFNRGRHVNINENTNRQFNDGHDEERCMKCIMIGRPCW